MKRTLLFLLVCLASAAASLSVFRSHPRWKSEKTEVDREAAIQPSAVRSKASPDAVKDVRRHRIHQRAASARDAFTRGQTSPKLDALKPVRNVREGRPVFESESMRTLLDERAHFHVRGSGDAVLGSLELTLSSVRSGTEIVYSHGGSDGYKPLGSTDAQAARGPIRERIVPVPGGLEQLFDVDARLGKGDLMFTFQVGGTLRGPVDPTTAEAITFWLDHAVGVTYGKVVAIDSSGRSIAVPVHSEGDTLSYAIPETWMSAAAYPIVVDPLVGTLITLGSPTNFYLSNSVGAAYNPSADEYLIVRNEINTDGDILGSLINATTGVPGADLNFENTAGVDLGGARVAFNPSNNRYLIVGFDVLSPTAEVMGLVVDATGVPVGGSTWFSISGGAATDDYMAAVACDGTNWMVVWYAQVPASTGDIACRRVDAASTNPSPVFGTAVTTVQAGANDESNPAIAYNGTTFLCVWWEVATDDSIKGRTISTTGAVGGTLNTYDSGAVGGWTREYPSVTANTASGEFLVGWDEWTTGTGDPVVRLASSAGAPQGSVIAVDADATNDGLYCTVQYNTAMNQYFVGWLDDVGTGFASYEVQANQLTSAGVIVLASDVTLDATGEAGLLGLNVPRTDVVQRTAAAGPTHVLMIWRHLDPAVAGPFPATGQRYDLNNLPTAPVPANMIQKQGGTASPPTDAEGVTYITLPRQESFSGGSSTDADNHDIQLQIERIQDSASFSGAFTEASGLVASGGSPTITVSAIPNGAYKWRARFVDEVGGASAWVQFGAPGGPDHTFNVPNQLPGVPDVTQNATTGQFQMNGTTQIPTGGLTPQGTVILKGSIGADPDGDNVRLEVEVQPVGTAFTNVPTLTSTFGAAGVHQVSFTPVTSTAGYHWQARVRDSSGAVNDTTAFVQYGLNPEPSGVDFARDGSANTTAVPTGPAQFEADGTTVIALGGTAGSRTVVLKATTTDPEGDQYQIEVEVKPISVAFDGTVTATSALFNSGTQASVSVTISGFAAESYHWQVRTRDALNATSAFVVFGANGDAPPAGVDFGVPSVDFGGSKNNLKCGLAAGALGMPWILAALALAGLARRRR